MRKSKELWAFEQRIASFSNIAHWYRLAIRIQGQAWIYPITKKPSPRFDGVERATPGFLIDPFEPPVVPIAGAYHLVLSDANGQRIPLPKGDTAPIVVVPCCPLAIEAGDRGH